MIIVITGQMRGGKNGIKTTRTGRRYPCKKWAAWRDDAVAQVRSQLPDGFQTIAEPVNVWLEYTAGDKRRRDMPAIIDAVWHVLERAGVVADDTLLWAERSVRGYDKNAPGVVIVFPEKFERT